MYLPFMKSWLQVNTPASAKTHALCYQTLESPNKPHPGGFTINFYQQKRSPCAIVRDEGGTERHSGALGPPAGGGVGNWGPLGVDPHLVAVLQQHPGVTHSPHM